jgi:hypothetical protein
MVMNQDAKVGLIVLGLVAPGILFAVESSRTPHQQFDPRFTLVVIVIGVICFAASWKRPGAEVLKLTGSGIMPNASDVQSA